MNVAMSSEEGGPVPISEEVLGAKGLHYAVSLAGWYSLEECLRVVSHAYGNESWGRGRCSGSRCWRGRCSRRCSRSRRGSAAGNGESQQDYCDDAKVQPPESRAYISHFNLFSSLRTLHL